MKKIKLSKWKVFKLFLILSFILFCLGAWPGYFFHDHQTPDLHPRDVILTQWVSGGDVVQQSFLPEFGRMCYLKLALAFDSDVAANDVIEFTVRDETDRVIYKREIFFDQIESRSLFDVPLPVNLKANKEYVWTLSASEDSNVQYAVLCTRDDINSIAENQSLMINGEDSHSVALNQYNYRAHYDKAIIIGCFWAGGALVLLIILELIDRMELSFTRSAKKGI